jgi:hypothetical protein
VVVGWGICNSIVMRVSATPLVKPRTRSNARASNSRSIRKGKRRVAGNGSSASYACECVRRAMGLNDTTRFLPCSSTPESDNDGQNPKRLSIQTMVSGLGELVSYSDPAGCCGSSGEGSRTASRGKRLSRYMWVRVYVAGKHR